VTAVGQEHLRIEIRSLLLVDYDEIQPILECLERRADGCFFVEGLDSDFTLPPRDPPRSAASSWALTF
jgi:hypothetical protein